MASGETRCNHCHAPESAYPAQCMLKKGHAGLHVGGGGSWGSGSSDDVILPAEPSPTQRGPEQCPYCQKPIVDEPEEGGYTHRVAADAIACPGKFPATQREPDPIPRCLWCGLQIRDVSITATPVWADNDGGSWCPERTSLVGPLPHVPATQREPEPTKAELQLEIASLKKQLADMRERMLD